MTVSAADLGRGWWAGIDDLVGVIQANLAALARTVSAVCERALDLSWSIAQWYVGFRRDHHDVAGAIDTLLALTESVGGLPGKILRLLRTLHDALLASS